MIGQGRGERSMAVMRGFTRVSMPDAKVRLQNSQFAALCRVSVLPEGMKNKLSIFRQPGQAR
jgi:hypothetical protein